MEVLKLGIDDAGRGPVIGPMILSGCLMTPDVERELKNLGVKDSKQLTQKRREFLKKSILEKSISVSTNTTSPDEIEKSNGKGIKLNELEAIKAAKIINKLNDGKKKIQVIVDCPSVSIVKWRDYLKTKITNLSNLDVVCEHKADVKHASVSAASVLAKLRREEEMDKLKQKYGQDMGSGYPSDPSTVKFLKKNIQKYDKEGIFRKTWKTWKLAAAQSSQMKLS
jgi:ribonuclease HII